MNKLNLNLYFIHFLCEAVIFMFRNLGNKIPKKYTGSREYNTRTFVGKITNNQAKYTKPDGTKEFPGVNEDKHYTIVEPLEPAENQKIYDNAVKQNEELPGQVPIPIYHAICAFLTSDKNFSGSKNCGSAEKINMLRTKINGQPGIQYVEKFFLNRYLQDKDVYKDLKKTQIIHQPAIKKEIESIIEKTPKKD